MIASKETELNEHGSEVSSVIAKQEFDINTNKLVKRSEEKYNKEEKSTAKIITKYDYHSDGELRGRIVTEDISYPSRRMTTNIQKSYNADGVLYDYVEINKYFNSGKIHKKYEYLNFDGNKVSIYEEYTLGDNGEQPKKVYEEHEIYNLSGKIAARNINSHEVDAETKKVREIKVSQKFDLDGHLQSCSGGEYINNSKVKDFTDINYFEDQGYINSDIARRIRSDHYHHDHIEHQDVKLDQLALDINGFDTSEGVATPVNKPFIPTMNSNPLVASL